MKIAISGAQSTGKSTLLRYLKNDRDLVGFEFIDELTRQLAAKGVSINEKGGNFTQIFTITIHAENILKKHFISDRSILDALVYTRWMYNKGKVEEWIMDYAVGVAKEILPMYDYVFYLPSEIPIEDDGVRSSSKEFRDEIEKLFEYYIEFLNLKVYKLTGSVADRASKFKEVLEPKMVYTADLTEITSLLDMGTTDADTNEYLTEAYHHWVKNGYYDDPNCKIFKTQLNGNKGWAFVREHEDDPKSCHFSRLTVERKGDGLGSRIIKRLQSMYHYMTLWSTPDAMTIHGRHGFVFSGETLEHDGTTYTKGVWDNRNK